MSAIDFESAIGRILGVYLGPVALQSFNPLTLAWFRRHAPDRLRFGHGTGVLVVDAEPVGGQVGHQNRACSPSLGLQPGEGGQLQTRRDIGDVTFGD
jgi:hypothetical protein